MEQRNEEENKRIYYLCQTIRTFMFGNAAHEVMNSDFKNKEALDAVEKTAADTSKIGILIKKRDWSTLFNDEEWLCLLEGAQNMLCLTYWGEANKALREISKMFPRETNCRIIPQLLPPLEKD